ncbi:DNA alkylation repair protein [Peribacillus sp. RS7]|uniref:DNA alkylation repair protein n=1 Tax=Peribacillus sp. RS7 TaxID=3242679 RepID=UPI0035BEF90E
MAEPLKDLYSETFIREFSEKVRDVHPSFSSESFIEEVMDEHWDDRKLKERIRHISITLGKHLPSDYQKALGILYRLDKDCEGFRYLFFPDFVEVHGLDKKDWQLSLAALERFTSKSSSEFAVRAFILLDPAQMIEKMKDWTKHGDEHVRRLASEGCRPRLPWGQSLPMFKSDPKPVLELLENLKKDSSLYVRKSVANNLNDIAKDHPKAVIETAKRWHESGDANTIWIVRRGCRNLVRQADPEVLSLFGYTDVLNNPNIISNAFIRNEPDSIFIGETSELHFGFRVQEKNPVKLRIEYAIDFVKANQKTSRKIFLLADRNFTDSEAVERVRIHNWKDLTTRRHYKGIHRISLLVNGVEVAGTHVKLNAES